MSRSGNARSSCLLLLLVLISILHDSQAAKQRNTANFIQSMNPIVRYRFTSHLKNRIQQLDAVKDRQVETRNSRNCFFSPVQCHLPVEVVGQQRPESLYVVNKFRKRLASLPFLKASTFNDQSV